MICHPMSNWKFGSFQLLPRLGIQRVCRKLENARRLSYLSLSYLVKYTKDTDPIFNVRLIVSASALASEVTKVGHRRLTAIAIR